MDRKKICVLGLGYIGLPTAALLANKGFTVEGVDIKESIITTINNGDIHIVEPGLDEYVKKAVENQNLHASLIPCKADIFIIAVPTPFHDGYIPNIDYIIAATKMIVPYIEENNIVILESTSPVGTTEKLEQTLTDEGVDTSKIYISHCPERVLPGNIMQELVENDRIVGGTNEEATTETIKFYKEFVSGEIFATDAKTAEMAKLTENSFRDVNIAFANELSILCDNLSIDVTELIRLANRHPRVDILNPGPGVGGHCIAVDPWFIINKDPENARIIKTAREINLFKTEWVIEKIKNEAEKFERKNHKKPKIACFGLAFKPDIDDLRGSPAMYIARILKSYGYEILAVEPNIDSHDDFEIFHHDEAINNSDLITILVAHKEFKGLNIETGFNFCGLL
jgi:UDP-N-acetyl-D-mannosaminuronic acid dehydrogenase|tara:strand:- start:19452 stop:20642 length:1191 start_codon:yes stop_codon:yes gene_type:complete